MSTSRLQMLLMFLLIQVLIIQWQPLQIYQVEAQVLQVDARSLLW
jgi:hypothetical protein